MNKTIVWSVLFLICMFSVHALGYTLSVGNSPSGLYEGEDAIVNAKVLANADNGCDLACTITCPDGHSEENPELTKGSSLPIDCTVVASGSGGVYNKQVTAQCQKQNMFCLVSVSNPTQSKLISFTFSYLGDGTCSTNKGEDCTKRTQEPSCACNSPKSCIDDKGDSSRGTDSYKCATYCGNGVPEKSYEDCSSCPQDVGKCDGLACNSKSECEGKYCVHNVCSHLPYITGDNFCDSSVGENCKNSASDCACGANERCGVSNTCETYCGNAICEASEQGVCKADCKWCGDSSCDAGQKESCKTCESDCGVCENKKVNEEIQQKTQEVVKQGIESSTQKQKTTIYTALGVIIAIIVGYIIYKVFKQKPSKKKLKSKRKRK